MRFEARVVHIKDPYLVHLRPSFGAGSLAMIVDVASIGCPLDFAENIEQRNRWGLKRHEHLLNS